MDMTQDDENKAIILLCSLSGSWDGVVTTISTSVSTKSKVILDDVAFTLLSEDMRRRNQETSSVDALTMVSIETKGRSHHRCKNHN